MRKRDFPAFGGVVDVLILARRLSLNGVGDRDEAIKKYNNRVLERAIKIFRERLFE